MKTRCGTCGHGVSVVGGSKRILELFGKDLWPQGYPCVQWHCDGVAEVVKPGEVAEVALDLTPEQYFRAVHSGGLPDEASPDFQTVSRLLSEQPFVGLSMTTPEVSTRPVVKAIELEKASLHLASSPHGAMIFKVTRRTECQAE